jgi:methylated-DNA-[protein]-cysteine S-methyltransferase
MVNNSRVYFSETESPMGPLLIAATTKGVCWMDFARNQKASIHLQRWVQKWFRHDAIESNGEYLTDVATQLQQYFEGNRDEFDVELELFGTPFQKMVWQNLNAIPYGETRSYKDVALTMGMPKAVRAIGGANNRNPVPIIVPCHRVVGSNGALVGYGGGLDIKEFLLNLEQQHFPQRGNA